MKHKYELGACALLLVALGFSVRQNIEQSREIERMTQLMEQYMDGEKRAKVTERISMQMEDIAYEQKLISDRERKVALLQRDTAMEMRRMAESEKYKAQLSAQIAMDAQQEAQQKEHEAVEQRKRAQTQQRIAEHARSQADTLSRIALGRSLASLSLKQHQSGKHATARRLAYAAWKYTSDYGGNLYYPELFTALSATSGSVWSRNLRQGNINSGNGITRILPGNKAGQYMAVSKYGEVFRWTDGRTANATVFADHRYDFRNAVTDGQGTLHALSYHGALVSIGQTTQVTPLPQGARWTNMAMARDGRLLLASARNIHFFNTTTRKVEQTIPVNGEISKVVPAGKGWMVFATNGNAWRLNANGRMQADDSWKFRNVTAYARSERQGVTAIGTADGKIYVISHGGDLLRTSEDHRSAITQLGFADGRLFSASMDKNIYMWDLDAAKLTGMQLLETTSWPYCFHITEDRAMWIGCENGDIYHLSVSPDAMAKDLKRQIKRGFTEEEWNYYVDQDVPMLHIK